MSSKHRSRTHFDLQILGYPETPPGSQPVERGLDLTELRGEALEPSEDQMLPVEKRMDRRSQGGMHKSAPELIVRVGETKCVCVYLYVCSYCRMHIHIYIYTYIHTYIHTCMHACMHACIHTYIHTYIDVKRYMQRRTHTCICIYIYIYIYICMYVCLLNSLFSLCLQLLIGLVC